MDGRFVRLQVAMDSTELRKAEEDKSLLEAQLRQAQKMEAIGTLAGGISHDFNNLLQAILGYTQILLLDKEKDDPEFEQLREIEMAARKAGELIRQLLTFSRKVESQLRPVDLNREVQQVTKMLKRTLPKMIDIKLNLQEDLKIINADTMYFPVKKKPEEKAQGEIEKKYPEGGSETVLLIDDEIFLRQLGKQMLTKFGYTVLTAPDGEKGLELYSQNRDDIHLIVLDLIMPGMGGERCLEELLKIEPKAKIVIASGYAIKGSIKETLEAGAGGFIEKPYQVNQILKVVREVLDRK